MDERDALLVSLMSYGGLRPSEAFALPTSHVGQGVLLVDRSYVSGRLKVTKTGLARSVQIVRPLAADLAAWHATTDVLCPDHRGGHIDLSNWRSRAWTPALKRAGIQAKPYDLRHTYCSLLAHEGRSMPYIADQMGHNVIETQRRYMHVIEEAKLAVAKPMVEAIEEARVHSVCSARDQTEQATLAEVIDLQAFREAGAAGIEPATLSLEGSCSIH